MDIPPELKHKSIEIITGCMFSGKTEELIYRINLAQKQGFTTAVFKPEKDNRYHTKNIVSHNGSSIESVAIKNSSDILKQISNIQVIGIDEAQFFDNAIIDICHQLATENYRIILSGLDKDYLNNPFGPMPGLISISENITQLAAICHQCGGEAFNTFKKLNRRHLSKLAKPIFMKPDAMSAIKRYADFKSLKV